MLRSIFRFVAGGAVRRFLWKRAPLLLLGYEAYRWYERRKHHGAAA
jgi:hypothetical protein